LRVAAGALLPHGPGLRNILFRPDPWRRAGCRCAASAAHPHVFIDAGITLMTDDDGAITSVEVTWLYDELYTLILLQDYELDVDFDGALTEAEVAGTLGFDLNWNSGFEGGLYLSAGRRGAGTRPARACVPDARPDGRMQTTHRGRWRAIPGAGVVEAQVYDAAFFIAFEATLPSGLAGTERCAPELVRADLDAAYAALEAELAAIGGVIAAEDNFPAVGALFRRQAGVCMRALIALAVLISIALACGSGARAGTGWCWPGRWRGNARRRAAWAGRLAL
jgi:hypothetical protein